MSVYTTKHESVLLLHLCYNAICPLLTVVPPRYPWYNQIDRLHQVLVIENKNWLALFNYCSVSRRFIHFYLDFHRNF